MQMKIYTTISVYTYSALYKSAYLAAFGKLLYDPYGCFTFTLYIISNDSNRSKCRLTSSSVAGPEVQTSCDDEASWYSFELLLVIEWR